MKVAFASSDGDHIDEHFGKATAFHIWEVEPSGAHCVGRLGQPDRGGDDEDHILAKATALEGCSIACSVQIGGPAAAKLVARHIHPMKTDAVVPIKDMVEKLQNVLRGSAPPWLAKTMGIVPARRLVQDLEE
jgi:nitrogen fixation protein NifX